MPSHSRNLKDLSLNKSGKSNTLVMRRQKVTRVNRKKDLQRHALSVPTIGVGLKDTCNQLRKTKSEQGPWRTGERTQPVTPFRRFSKSLLLSTNPPQRVTQPHVPLKPATQPHVPSTPATQPHVPSTPATQPHVPSTPATQPHGPSVKQPTAASPKSVLLPISKEEFQINFVGGKKLGNGAFGCVYCGHRIKDSFPVAIKRIPKNLVKYVPVVINQQVHTVPLEALFMTVAAGEPVAVGQRAPISLLAWCNTERDVLLIMERPKVCRDLVEYMKVYQMTEGLAKMFMKQLVAAAIQLNRAGIFHSDLKRENILIEHCDGWSTPRVRIIDFGCAAFVTPPGYAPYAGTLFYQPPELAIRGMCQAGPATVWQLGAILLEMLTEDVSFAMQQLYANPYLLGMEIAHLNVSQACKHFLSGCFSFYPETRMTMEQMWGHPWLR